MLPGSVSRRTAEVAHDAAQGDIAAGRGRAGLLAAAAARVIYTSSGAGVITLPVIGALLLVSPFVIARVERLSVNARGLDAATDPDSNRRRMAAEVRALPVT